MKTVNAWKKIVDALTEECTENIDEVKIAEYNSIECDSLENINKYSSCTL